MPHLYTPRKGWENEKLASYLLSRFSFVAQPTSVADDLGSDFFCTIFEIRDNSGTDVLLPRSSFAIQVKSSMSEVSMDNKIDYLERMQMPFFIGVVNQSPGVMRVFSAELLPFLFAHKGKPERLSMLPMAASDLNFDNYVDTIESDFYRLRCPEVAEFRVDEDRSMLAPKVETLLGICTRAQGNIATRLSEEHIYDFDGKGNYQILAGRGSARHFRMNLVKRLGEAFLNLDWELNAGVQPQEMMQEFRAFERLYQELEQIYPPMPLFVSVPYGLVKSRLTQS
jgi:hypothetical protein